MINEGNLDEINKGILTTKELNTYGFNSVDLKNFQLFLKAVQSKDYSKAFTYFEQLYNSDNEYYNNDNNFYLYLLSMITEIPEKHREYVKCIQLEDIRIDLNDKRFEDHYSQNKVRLSALNQKFILASKQLNELIKQQGGLSVQDIIVRTLLSQAIEVQNDLRKNIVNLVIEKKYNEIISSLEEMQEQHRLSVANECILFLAKEISKIKETGIIPEKELINANTLVEAINGKNFELALSLSKEYIERNNINQNDNAMYMLLKDITNLTGMKTNEPKEQPVIESTKNEKIVSVENVAKKTFDDSKFINSKLDELYDKGIILLRPMDSSSRKVIHNIVKDIPDVVSFSIGPYFSRQVVLRFKPYIDEYVNFPAIAKKGNIAYSNGQYDECIESYKKLLKVGEPKARVYARLGLAYMKKSDNDTAIDYLTIATALSEEEKSDFDFTELIASLRGLMDSEEKKPRFKMSTEDFSNDTENYYGIKKIEEIGILVSYGISLKRACDTFELTDEEKNIVYLIFAREFYSKEMYVLGDKYIKLVEKTKNKTKFVKTLLDEIKKNKKFYKNRVNEGHKKLLLDN